MSSPQAAQIGREPPYTAAHDPYGPATRGSGPPARQVHAVSQVQDSPREHPAFDSPIKRNIKC